MIKRNAHNFILAIFVVVILTLTIKYIEENLCISVIGDEFGYWSAAAFITDKPWHSLVSTNSYYGWGYGVILSPILYILSQEPVVMYQTAIVVNGIMLCFILMVSYKCVLRFSDKKNTIQAALIAGIVTLYPANFFSVYNTMPEILLQLLYWLMVWAVLMISEREFLLSRNKKGGMIFLLLLLSVYIFCVHQRTIGLLIDSVIFLVCFYKRTEDKKIWNIFKVLCVIVILCVTAAGIKQLYMDWLYSPINSNDSGKAALDNDFSGIVSNISFSWNVLRGIGLSAIGKIYYSFTASALLVGAGVFICLKKSIKRKDNRILLYIFIILGWLQAVGIAAIGMPGGFELRTDILIYGRYVEYTLGPLMAVGLVGICQRSMSYIEAFILIILQSVIAIVTSVYIAPESVNTNMGNIFTLSRIFQSSSNHDAVFAGSLIAVFIFSTIFMLRYEKISHEAKFILICLCEVFIFTQTYQHDILPWQRSANENVHVIQTYDKKRGVHDRLYVLNGGVGGKMIQFLYPDEECLLIKDINDVEDGSFVITQYTKDTLRDISQQYNVLYHNNIIILWRK